jgi:uncharacterized protein
MTAPASRIAELDTLRGAGILGILVVHIQLFAMPLAVRSNPRVHGDLQGIDRVIWLTTYVLADGKFIAMFAMLFGAGIAMLAARGATQGLAAAPQHYRRMATLFVIGILHAYLLWYGDMLVTFALSGALVFLHRDLAPTRLIVAGVVTLAVAPILSSALAWAGPDVLSPSKALSTDVSPVAIAGEIAAYRDGWLQQQTHRVPAAWRFQTSYLLLRGIWQTTGLMLLGMGLFRFGILTGERTARWYAGMAAAGFAAGIPLMVAGAWRGLAHDWDVRERMLVGIHFEYWGSVLVGLGWVGAVLLVHRRRAVPRAVVAVGRTALSNYLLATILCTTVFYGHGLGLFGAVDRVGQMAVVGVVWAIQLIVSPWWLRRFAMGPAEWVLRCVTHRRRVPLRLTSAEAPA